jgi:hypothetical protein
MVRALFPSPGTSGTRLCCSDTPALVTKAEVRELQLFHNDRHRAS